MHLLLWAQCNSRCRAVIRAANKMTDENAWRTCIVRIPNTLACLVCFLVKRRMTAAQLACNSARLTVGSIGLPWPRSLRPTCCIQWHGALSSTRFWRRVSATLFFGPVLQPPSTFLSTLGPDVTPAVCSCLAKKDIQSFSLHHHHAADDGVPARVCSGVLHCGERCDPQRVNSEQHLTWSEVDSSPTVRAPP